MSKPPPWSPPWQRFFWLLLAIVLFAATSVAVILIPFAIGMKGQSTSPLALAIFIPAAILLGYLYTVAANRVTMGGFRQRLGGLAAAQIFVFLGTAIVGPVYIGSRSASGKANCLSSAKQLSLGLIMYASDNDDRLPPSDRWRTVSARYLKEPLECRDADSKWHYGFNAALSGTSMIEIESPAETVMVFEMDGLSRDAAGGIRDAAFRHYGSCTVAVVEGYAKGRDEESLRKLHWNPK